jgi:hemerythrin HHE cation binding domain-containing protein
MDITELILDDHRELRRLFAVLEEIEASDIAALTAVWNRLRGLLDTHAEAEERHFYPRLMKIGRGANDAPTAADATKDAIEDHNKIRDTAAAVDRHEVGSKQWFEAVGKANEANSHHMAEEERQGLTDFRRQASLEDRHRLAVRFIAFETRHLDGVEPVNKDADEYVEQHAPR